ncbi:MAG: hypothetical protein QM796_06455 [Chthoniobacteraceae bacterium]
MAEMIEDEAVDGIDAVGLEVEAELGQIVEPGRPAGEQASVAEIFEIELVLAEGHGIADEFLDQIGHGDDALGAAVFIKDDREALRAGEEAAEQIERLHRLGDEGGRAHKLGIGDGGIEQQRLDVEDAEDVIGRVAIDGHAMVALGLELADGFLVGEIVGDGEDIDARRHAIADGLVTKLDDFLDDLGFRRLERAFLGADFHERLQFVIAQDLGRLEAFGVKVLAIQSEKLCRRRLIGSSNGIASCRVRTPIFAML